MSVVVRHFLSDLNGSPRRQPSFMSVGPILGCLLCTELLIPAKLCPEPGCSKTGCPGEQAVPSSKKENPVELSKSPGSIYILRLPLTVPLGWAYGDEAAAVTVLAIDWKHTPWDKVICAGELSLLPISVCFIDGTWPAPSSRYEAPVLS